MQGHWKGNLRSLHEREQAVLLSLSLCLISDALQHQAININQLASNRCLVECGQIIIEESYQGN